MSTVKEGPKEADITKAYLERKAQRDALLIKIARSMDALRKEADPCGERETS